MDKRSWDKFAVWHFFTHGKETVLFKSNYNYPAPPPTPPHLQYWTLVPNNNFFSWIFTLYWVGKGQTLITIVHHCNLKSKVKKCYLPNNVPNKHGHLFLVLSEWLPLMLLMPLVWKPTQVRLLTDMVRLYFNLLLKACSSSLKDPGCYPHFYILKKNIRLRIPFLLLKSSGVSILTISSLFPSMLKVFLPTFC